LHRSEAVWKDIDKLGFGSYYSKPALELAWWAAEEKNRIKATRIKVISNRLEERYRKNHDTKKKVSNGRVTKFNSPTPVFRPVPPPMRPKPETIKYY
jgi:hypothetical protein